MNRKFIRILFVVIGLGYLISPDLVPGWMDDILVIVAEAIIYTLLSKKKVIK